MMPMPIVYSVQTIDEQDAMPVTKRGLLFSSSYAEAVKKIEASNSIIIDMYLTSVEVDAIELSEEAYNNLLDGKEI